MERTMNKILKPIAHGLSLVALLCVSDAQAIIGVAPGGSVARRHAVVATTTVVAASSANASAAATANANAAAANANAQAAAAKTPAPTPAPTPVAAPGAPPPVGSTVTTLPPGCVQTDLNGVAYQRCGSTYYKPSMMGSTLVFVVAQP
jgi:hypothetical protein